VLVARRDPSGLPALIAALEVRSDFLAGTKPRAVDVIAQAIGAIGKPDATAALVAHFLDPETPLPAVQALATALAAGGDKAAIAPMRGWLLMYRADPMFASDTTAISAVIDALLKLGGGAERELISYVASEPRTQEKVAEYSRRALSQTAKEPSGSK
jgi:HEAT repeat protein